LPFRVSFIPHQTPQIKKGFYKAGRCLTENRLTSFVNAAVCITAGGKRRHIATSLLPPFVAFCRSGFVQDFSSSQSLGDGVCRKLPADKGKTNARYSL
jgi:hypothetical protein